MAKSRSIEDIRLESEAITQRYDALFAGKARATRDLDALDLLISELEELIKEGQIAAQTKRDPGLIALLETLRDNLDVYRQEHVAIAEAKAQGDHVVQGAVLASWANLVFDQYHRHFAGRNRATRDSFRLQEMIEELQWLDAQFQALSARSSYPELEKDREAVVANTALYVQEVERIDKARRSGNRDEQASVLAEAANDQFRAYRLQFAGRSRSSRRPETLKRIIDQLEAIQLRMRELKRLGYRSDVNMNNIRTVQSNLDVYRNEYVQVSSTREQISDHELAGHLGHAANRCMEQYKAEFAGQDRRTRDLELLSGLCDEMYDIALQMRGLDWNTHDGDDSPESLHTESGDSGNEGQHRLGGETKSDDEALPEFDASMNRKNLQIVLDALVMYESEYKRIQEAQGLL